MMERPLPDSAPFRSWNYRLEPAIAGELCGFGSVWRVSRAPGGSGRSRASVNFLMRIASSAQCGRGSGECLNFCA
jgi:hypothetical protein